MDINILSTMKVEELKNFLRLRGLRVTGKKEELVARVFIAMENDVPVLKSAEEVQKEISEEYAKKLTHRRCDHPRPILIKNGLA